ncbi:MAG: hypothetical protein N4A54_08410 [Peptostreptococcaceae bacterium]|nr:hypothetical protein [Peptostreptococcaceae bacterium]
MGILLGILTSILTICALVALEVYANFDISSLTFFFIAPAGGIIIGACSTFGFKFMKKSKLKLLLCFIFSLSSLFIAKYIVFKLTCIDPQTGVMYYSYNDENSISVYVKFKDYYKLMVETATRTIRFKSTQGPSFTNTTYNYITEVISLLGVLFGSLFAAFDIYSTDTNNDDIQNNQENQTV